LASGRFRGFLRKKHRNTCGFAWEFLRSGQRYRPGKRLERRGKSSMLHSKKIFCLGVQILLSHVVSRGLLSNLGPIYLALGTNR